MVRRARYTPKHIGLQVKLTIPNVLIPILDVMDNQSVGTAIREAMRSAGRPATVALKNILRADLINSDQSTGATERAVGMKYGRSKLRPLNFYVIVGIEKSHYEIHTSKVPEGFKTKLRKGRKQRGMGLFGLQTRTNKKGVRRSKQVFSRYRNEYRITKLAGRPFKRWPKKYFHLIDRGFNHYRAGRVNGYEFISKLRTSIGSSMQQTFEKRLKELIIPTIKRELIRKFRSVLK